MSVDALLDRLGIDLLDPQSWVAVTGRISDWVKNGYGRLPVSCTVFQVVDSMEGESGIEDSWVFCSKALRGGAGVAVHLGNLRPRGTRNDKGLEASGPISFAQIYSKLNEILRRGGAYKNGAVNVHLPYTHPDAREFVNAPRELLPWVKRTLTVDEGFVEWDGFEDALQAIKKGDLWLTKSAGTNLRFNVCLEISLEHRGTCLLSHVNLGACKISDISRAMRVGMEFLCELHSQTGIGDTDFYLSPEEDRQVGLGLLGLSNLLAIEGVRYIELVEALEKMLGVGEPDGPLNPVAVQIAMALQDGYKTAASIARQYGMERAFTIAPCASVAYRYEDREGWVCSPEVSAPIDRCVDRDSATFGVQSYDHNPKCEVAEEVGFDVHFRLNACIQELMERTGLAHSISFNVWSDVTTIDKGLVQRWLDSPLKSWYYSLQVMRGTQNKDDVLSALDDYEQLELEFFKPLGAEMERVEEPLNIPCIGCSE